jgi:lipoyl(octanoyl) transferase
MNIEIKKSIKPIKYNFAIKYMERRLDQISKGGAKELIWILEHDEIYTGGTSFKDNEILDKSINFIKTNRGGKITFHGPGQLIFYFIIDLRKRDINIRKLISSIEKTIIDTLSYFKIKSFADRKNIGIWYRNNKNIEKVAAIGIKVKKWIAYHGFSININIDLKKYEKIIPFGIKEKKITNLIKIKKQNYKIIKDMLIKNFLTNIQN